MSNCTPFVAPSKFELFRINGGKQGYYIADIQDKKYYYCGTEWEDVKLKLGELGIGRPDPMEA
ncbi:hypothetical protein B4U84_28835 [Westiellopsis prolifica IICB1]|nr:hypothetical protein B4U84_28835 [Westiellopsis prolifica IICB1]